MNNTLIEEIAQDDAQWQKFLHGLHPDIWNAAPEIWQRVFGGVMGIMRTDGSAHQREDTLTMYVYAYEAETCEQWKPWWRET